MRLAVVGSRAWPSELSFWIRLAIGAAARKHPLLTIVTGDAQGVDSFARQAAESLRLPCLVFAASRHTCQIIGPHTSVQRVADWDFHGTKAGPIRNGYIVRTADEMAAFRVPFHCRGTDNSISQMQALGKFVQIFEPSSVPPGP